MHFLTDIFKKKLTRSKEKAHCYELVEALTTGLISRDGEHGMACFTKRLESVAPHFLSVWNNGKLQNNGMTLCTAVFSLLQTLDSNIVDARYPAYRDGGMFKNSFSPVRMLLSLGKFCMGKENSWFFFQILTETIPDNIHFHIGFARSLLENKRYREAADIALAARRIDPMDYCCARIVNDTQKTLSLHGLQPDFSFALIDNTDRFCELPFLERKYVLSNAGRDAFAVSCCPSVAWLPLAFEIDPSWNSEDLQELRRSILDGSFRYCDEYRCVFMQTGTLPPKKEIQDTYLRSIIDNNLTCLPKGPQRLQFAYDVSCNLTCPSCRGEVIMADKRTTTILNAKMDKELALYLQDAKELCISHTGEALASKHSMHILHLLDPKTYPNLRVELLTNLSLVSAKKWEELGASAQSIREIFMSVDGGTPETLEKLRRGLKWSRMLEALNFIRELRTSGQLEKTTISFLLQKDNYLELKELLDLASRYRVDVVMVTTIVTPGSYSSEEFNTLNVCDPANPLFIECQNAVEELKLVHEGMLRNKRAIEAAGCSVPELFWRLF